MQIAMVGTGYVGLVTGTCLADAGNQVTCLDIDAKRIEALNQGQIPIYEPGLAEVTSRNRRSNRLRFTTDYASAIPGADLCFIAVGTPAESNGSADLRYVFEAARSIAEHMTGFLIVVDKSTVPVGTAQVVEEAMREHTSHSVSVISNPEFLKEGDAVRDFATPDRVIVGYDSEGPGAKQVRSTVEGLYRPFTDENRPLVFMNRESAELTKYAANAMLATRISFMNEIANLCERVGANVDDVSRGIGLDGRIGPLFLRAGLGYGGSCFPKDVRAIAHTAEQVNYDLHLVKAVDRINEAQKRRLAEQVLERFGTDLSDRVFAIWGLAFKPETDDMREAPSLTTIATLLEAGAKLHVYDPEATNNFRTIVEKDWPKEHQDRISYTVYPSDATNGTDAVLLVTEWKEFRSPNWVEIKRRMTTPVVFDGRNVYDRKALEELGFEYHAIGR